MESIKQRLLGLLRRSERYTKTDMAYVASGGFWLVAAQGTSILISIPLSIAFAHLLTQNEYGIYRYALSAASLLSVFSLTGLSISIARSVARGHEGVLREGFRMNLLWSIGLVFIAIAAALYYYVNDNVLLALSFVIIAFATPLLNSATLYGSFLNGKKLFRESALYATGKNLFGGGAVFIALIFSRDPLIVVLAFFVAHTLAALYYYLRTLRLHVKNTESDPGMVGFAKHSSIFNGLALFADRIDSIIVFQFLGAAELAIYSFAEIIPDALNRFSKNISSLALPKYAADGRNRRVFGHSALFALVLLPLAILYALAAPYIFQLFFPAYMESVPLTQALGFLVVLTGALPATYLDAQRAIREKYIVSLVVNISKIAFIVLGLALYGLWGVIFARFASKFVSAGVTFAVVKRLQDRTASGE